MAQCFTLSQSDLAQSKSNKKRASSAQPALRTGQQHMLQFNAKDTGQTKRIEVALKDKDPK